MSRQTLNLTDTLYEYLLAVSSRETEVLRRLREETARLPEARMQIAPEQGQFMALLLKLMGARRAIDVGTYTGYSALSMAQALPDDGQVVCCDLSREWTDIARRYWEEAGVSARMDLRLQPALDTLDELIAEGRAWTFDFAFIDADKENYEGYYERCLRLLRPGGLIAVDNVLWHGSVADPVVRDSETRAIRAFNRKLRDDRRIELSLVPIGDGVTLALKR